MVNYILSYATLAVLFIVQTTLSRYVDIAGVAPDLIFIFAVCYSMYNFPVRSAVLCVIAGLLADMYSMSFVGVNALIYLYIGIAISNFASILIKKNLWTVSLGVFVVSFLYHTVILVVNYILPGHSTLWYPLLRYVVPTAFYDAVASMVVALWARRLSMEKIRGF